MRAIGDFIISLSQTISLWRDGAIAALAVLVIFCLYIYASAVGE